MMTIRISTLPFSFMKAQSLLTNYMSSSSMMKYISNMKQRRTLPRHLLAPTLLSNYPTNQTP